MAVIGAADIILRAADSWAGVKTSSHRFGGIEFLLGQRELGHIHGDHLVDIPFPTRIRNEIIAADQAEPHHILPESGWGSLFLREPEDIDRAIQLLQLSYNLAARRQNHSA